jgi:sugar lactone lactonase YvrE
MAIETIAEHAPGSRTPPKASFRSGGYMQKMAVTLALLINIALSQICICGPFISSESATYDPLRKRYLISDQGNGNITQIDSLGNQSFFSTIPNVTKGLYIRGDTLFAAGGPGGLYLFDLETADTIMRFIFPGQVNLNDVHADTSGNIYASDPQGNRVHKLHLSDMSTETILTGFTMANGLYFDPPNNRLFAVQWINNSPISAINLDDYSVSVVADDGLDLLDGLTEDNAGNIYVSAFGTDAVHRYDRAFSRPPVIVSSGHQDPGDIFYDKINEMLVVPNVTGSDVDFVYLPVGPVISSYNFSDDTYGDGDGLLESGETIELTFDLKNTRPDSIYGVVVNLSIDDVSLTVSNGSAGLGDLAFGEVGDNYSDPWSFSIPADYVPRTNSFEFEVTYTFRDNLIVGTESILQQVGAPQVLIIDDDDGFSFESYYTEFFDSILIPYEIVDSSGARDLPDLFVYDVVVWFTGYSRSNAIDAGDVTIIKSYLDGGGKFFLTGQGIAADLDGSDPGFLNNYLKCEYLSTSFLPLLPVSAGSQVFLFGDTIIISGGDGAGNQSQPDHIAAINGGVGELNHFGSSDLGAVSFDGASKLVFFSFGYEGIPNNNSRFMTRYDVMYDVLDFLEYQFPAKPPTVSDMIISPGDTSHMTDHTPDISWTYQDDESNPQQYYQIQVGSDDDWTNSEMWDSGPIAETEPQATYTGDELVDGERYYLRIRASNQSVWSEWIYGQFKMNSVPIPDGLTPSGMEPYTVNPPVLSHLVASDGEDDTLTYSYQLYADSGLTGLIEDANGLNGGAGDTTGWQTSTILTEYEDYYWRVRCNDGYEDGAWTNSASFLLLPEYICGDANNDEQVNVGDAVFLINYVFKGGDEPQPICAGNANGDDQVNVGDAVYLINHVFKGGPEPSADCCSVK